MTTRLGKVTRGYTISFDRHSKHSPSRLSAAMHPPAEVGAWIDYPAKIDLRVGASGTSTSAVLAMSERRR